MKILLAFDKLEFYLPNIFSDFCSMKIGFDAKRAFQNKSGLGNYSRDLIRMLERSNRFSSIVLFRPKSTTLFIPGEKTLEVGPKNRKFSSLWRMFSLFRESEKYDLDIFHGLSNELPFGKKGKIKTIVTIHDLIFERFPKWYSSIDCLIYRFKTKNACKRADKIVAISEQTKKDLIELYQVPASKISVVYQGCHSAFLQDYSISELQVIQEKYQLPNQFALQVGTIESRKNALLSVKAVHQVKDLPLILIGKKTDYFSTIEKYIQDYNLGHRIKRVEVDNMEDLAKIYALSTLFLYPSIFEGFGIPIIEALFSKTPVITNKLGVFPEAGGPNSYYVSIDEEAEMVEKIQYILDNPVEVKKSCEESYTFANKFREEALLKSWEKIYFE
jgi:glycosyltransferase involved in cell wall biosynthesis